MEYFDLKEETENRLKEAKTEPNKIRGQNFLVNNQDLDEIVNELKLTEDEHILEIGPGVGNLTEKLLEKGVQVTAVEIDTYFANFLSKRFKENTKIVNSDILHFDETIMKAPYSVVGNIPYYITGKIIRKFLESKNQPKKIVLTVQKEVAERIAKVSPDASFVSNVAHLFADVEIVLFVPRDHFWPSPKVDSAVIVLTPHSSTKNIESGLIHFIKNGFAQPRKTLKNNLKNALGVDNRELESFFQRKNFSETVRPHEISLDDWKALFNHFSNKSSAQP